MAGKRSREHSNEPSEKLAERKKQRTFTNKDVELADLYEKLADDESDIRLKAARDLVARLLSSKLIDHDLIEKALKRLIKGLCSSRKSARFGFSLALTELLRQLYGSHGKSPVAKRDLISFIENFTKTDGNIVGQERKDHYFGRLYACRSIIQSDICYQSKDDIEIWGAVLQLISQQARLLPWIREETGLVLCEGIKKLNKLPYAQKFAQSSLDVISRAQILETPEGVAAWLTLMAQVPEFNDYPKNVWSHKTPLHRDNASKLNKVMREQYETQESESKTSLKAGTWQQSVSSTWTLVLELAIEADNSLETFNSTWKNLIDGGLFAEKSSLERKFWGFQIFSRIIRTVPAQAIKTLFSRNVVHSLIDNASSNQKMLHDAARDCLKRIKATAEAHPENVSFIVKALINEPGTIFFDRITKTKTLEEVLSNADDVSMSRLIEVFDTLIIRQDGSEQKAAENARQAIADILLGSFKLKLKTMKTLKTSKTPRWISDTTELLLRHGYTVPRNEDSNSPKPPLTTESRSMFSSRLTSIFGHLLSARADFVSSLAWKTVKKLRSMTKSSKKDHRLVLQADDNILETISKAYDIAHRLADDNNDESADAFKQAILILFCLTLLQVYGGETGAVTELEDLIHFDQATTTEENSRMHFDLLLELLLGLSSRQSVLFRNMAEQVFAAISGHISGEGLNSLYNILLTAESVAGQAELFESQNNEEGHDDSQEDDSDEIDSDVEIVDQLQDGASTDESDGSEESEEEQNEDEDDNLKEFNEKLAKVLQTSSTFTMNGEDESDGESMNDDDMMAIDSQIVQVFQQRRIHSNKNKDKKAARGNIANFKRRVLDLLTIYVKQETNNPLSLTILLPLLQLIRTTKEQTIEAKAGEVLRNYYNTSSRNKSIPVLSGLEDTVEILRSIHTEVQLQSSKLHTSACSKASLFVVKALVNHDKKAYDDAVDIYSTTQRTWFRNKAMSIQPTFFTEWISWSSEMRKQN